MDSRKLFFLLFFVVFSEIPFENEVWVLTEENFQEALTSQPGLLVEFYAPWCGHCKKLAPEYSKAAKRLKDRPDPIFIAKIDGSVSSNLTEKYEVKGYPTLKYFNGSKAVDYSGSKTEDGIVNWVLKKTGNPYAVILTLSSLKANIEKNKVSVVLFAELNSQEHSLFTLVSKTVDDPSFFLCNDPDAYSFYKVKSPAVVVFKHFDEKRVDYSGVFSSSEIINFVEKHKRPLIEEYNEDLDELIFEKNKPCLLLLRHESEAKNYEKILKRISKQLEGKILVTYKDMSTEEQRKLVGNFGLIGKRQPGALILDPGNDTRYYLDGSITEETLKKFLKD